MSQLSQILLVQKSLEDSFAKKMGDLEAQIQSAGPAKDTVAKVADEFRTFRELMFSMLSLLRQQITECARQLDGIEMRHRRKALVFFGIPDADKEDCKTVILDQLSNRLALSTFTTSSITACHRLGVRNDDHHRPILVRFANADDRNSVWRAKTGLKGSSISVKEFLTKSRQSIFSRARLHFGMHSCWTQDGVIVIKAQDGSRHKIVAVDELTALVEKYPNASSLSSSAGRGVTGPSTEKNRKQ